MDLTIRHLTMVHSQLKQKKYGIRSNANSLIKSGLTSRRCLTNITQHTHIHSKNSDSLIMKLGVPQGSVVGPLLPILCTYDISDCTNFRAFELFAEDTNTFVNLLKMISVREVWNLAVSRLTLIKAGRGCENPRPLFN